MQKARRAAGSRVAAIVAAACILLVNLFALRHEAEVAHVRDSHGAMEHAHALADRHEESAAQHVHGSDPHGHSDSGACALLAALEQTAVTAKASTSIVATQTLHVVACAPAAVLHALVAVLAFAPKTSPPASIVA